MNSLVLVTTTIALLGQPATDDTAFTTDVERANETVRLARLEGERYQFEVVGDPAAALKLRETPILKWSNPSEGALFGSVMLWTLDGRPAAVASCYRWFVDRREYHAEFKSLSSEGLKATRSGEPIWDASTSDIKFQELPGQFAPDASPTKRLSQMREIARRFSADLVHPQKGMNALRLLTQPVYRYEETKGNLIDGGMFAFVQGTDPEVFVMLEARRTDAGPQWHYAIARMNMFQLRVKLGEKEVWQADELTWNRVASRKDPYMIFVLEKIPVP